MQTATRYREITVSGSPREMGRQLGEAAGELVRGFVAVALDRANLVMRVSRSQAETTAANSLEYAEQYLPSACEELRGLAEATGLSLIDVMLLQVRNQWRPEPEAACTSLAVSTSAKSGQLLAQNWDADPALDPYTIVLTRKPTGKPAIMNVTQAGLIAYIGLNDAGIGACVNTLPAPSRPIGVPHYFTVRQMYESRTRDEAIEAVRRAHRAIPANIMISSPQGPADLEVTIDDIHVLEVDTSGKLTHANHCRHPGLAPINDQFPELIQSQSRQHKVDELSAAEDLTVERVKQILSDHEGFPRSICRHTNPDANVGHWQTVFSIIMEPEYGRMHVTRGTPCCKPYEVYQLKD